MLKLIGLKTCSTCKAIEKQLKIKGLEYDYQDVRENRPSKKQIENWLSLIGEDQIRKLVNTSGLVYRELNLKDKWANLSLNEQIELLASDGMLVKRPILVTEDQQIFIGNEAKKCLEEDLIK